jgi:hypothetical protein
VFIIYIFDKKGTKAFVYQFWDSFMGSRDHASEFGASIQHPQDRIHSIPFSLVLALASCILSFIVLYTPTYSILDTPAGYCYSVCLVFVVCCCVVVLAIELVVSRSLKLFCFVLATVAV